MQQSVEKNPSQDQGPPKIVKWGANIHIFVFTYLENNGFQKKLIMQNINI